MKVKIGDTVFDSNYVPIMIILEDIDKKNISNMHPRCNKYCSYPSEGWSNDDIIKWMEK